MPLPKGTRLDAESTWDNTADNPRNPSDAYAYSRAIRGLQSKDEMGSLTLVGVQRMTRPISPLLRRDLLQHRNRKWFERG